MINLEQYIIKSLFFLNTFRHLSYEARHATHRRLAVLIGHG